VGNAAALLLVKPCCSKVYPEVRSELAAQTLRDAKIKFEFKLTIPFTLTSAAMICVPWRGFRWAKRRKPSGTSCSPPNNRHLPVLVPAAK
jgi:hypothetical protein